MARPVSKFAIFILGLAIPVVSHSAEPTEYEQYLLELVNRARANPTAEVSRVDAEAASQPGYWGSYTRFNSYDGFAGVPSLNEGPPTLGGSIYRIHSAARQPLAFNLALVDGARAYVAQMQMSDSISHNLGGTSVNERIRAQGYTPDYPLDSALNNYLPSAENNAYTATSQSFDHSGYPGDIRKESIDLIHHILFADRVLSSRGHRVTILTSDWQEAGFALNFGNDGIYSSVYANHVFAHQNNRGPFITGVAYNDTDGDNFYTPESGEAISALTVTVYQAGTLNAVATTSTFASGGYGVAVPAGTYDLRFENADGSIGETRSGITVGELNVKVDAVSPGSDGGVDTREFAITRIAITGNSAVITWSSSPGSQYQVRTISDQSSWTIIPGSQTTATGTQSTYSHPNATVGVTERFYQIEKL